MENELSIWYMVYGIFMFTGFAKYSMSVVSVYRESL